MARTWPLWLAQPTRFAGLSKAHARVVLALFFALLLLCLSALLVPDPQAGDAATGGSEQTDLMLYEKVVAGLRGGGGYYSVAVDAMRASEYPLRPFVTMRMPALASLQAALPAWASPALLLLLAMATGVAWAFRLAPALPRIGPRLLAAALMLGSMLAFVQPDLSALHELWAGLLIAWSLALRRPGRWIEAAALALAAMLIRETAALYGLVMLALAWAEGERREALGWAAALVLFATALAAHAHGVAGVTGPVDASSPGWAGLLGPGFFVRAITLSTALQLLPLAIAAPIVALALIGWAGWRDSLALRTAAMLLAYATAIALFARADNFYWALIAAPMFLVGLVFVPDALRDLFRAAAALDKPRIRVTRVAR